MGRVSSRRKTHVRNGLDRVRVATFGCREHPHVASTFSSIQAPPRRAGETPLRRRPGDGRDLAGFSSSDERIGARAMRL